MARTTHVVRSAGRRAALTVTCVSSRLRAFAQIHSRIGLAGLLCLLLGSTIQAQLTAPLNGFVSEPQFAQGSYYRQPVPGGRIHHPGPPGQYGHPGHHGHDDYEDFYEDYYEELDEPIIGGDGGFDSCYDCETSWFVDVAPLWLQRDRSMRFEVGRFMDDAGNTTSRLHTRDVHFDFETGLRIAFGFGISEETVFEFVWEGIGDWEERQTLHNPRQVSGYSNYLGTASPAFNGIGDSFQYDVASEFFSGEFNLKRHLGGHKTELLAGFRYIYFRDWLSLTGSDTISQTGLGMTESTSIRTRNNMFGLQIGLERPLTTEVIRITFFAKAGAFFNVANQYTSNTGAGLLFPAIDEKQSELAIAGLTELGFTGRARLKSWLYLVGSYRVIHLTSLALAPEQLSGVNTVGGLLAANNKQVYLDDRVEVDSSVWMHGFTASLEFVW